MPNPRRRERGFVWRATGGLDCAAGALERLSDPVARHLVAVLATREDVVDVRIGAVGEA